MGSKKKASKPKKIKKQVSGPKPILVAIKVPPAELAKLKAQAKKYAKGNLSAWFRHTGLRYRLKPGEIVVSVTMPSVKPVKKKKR